MRTKAALAALLLPLLPTTASHATVQIAILQGGIQTTVATGAHNAAFSGPSGDWDFNNISVSDLTDLLNSTNLNASTTTPDDITILVTTTDHPAGTYPTRSGYTDNLHPPGWTITETTFWDPANQPFAQTTQLGQATFTAIGNKTQDTTLEAQSPFSLTATYLIEATTPGTDLATIKISGNPLPIPEPGPTLPFLLTGLLTLGLYHRRWTRKR